MTLTKQRQTVAAVRGRSILAAAVLLTAGAGITGCTKHVNSWQGAVSAEPMVVDGAMDRRDWTPSSAVYADKKVIAGPSGVVFIPAYNMPQQAYPWVDAPISLGNFIMMPVTLIMTPPWSEVTYSGEVVESSYHAQPPLPEGPVPMSQGVRDTGGAGSVGNGSGTGVAASPGTGSQTGVANSGVGASGAGAPTVGTPNAGVSSPTTPGGRGPSSVNPSGTAAGTSGPPGAVLTQPNNTSPGQSTGGAGLSSGSGATPGGTGAGASGTGGTGTGGTGTGGSGATGTGGTGTGAAGTGSSGTASPGVTPGGVARPGGASTTRPATRPATRPTTVNGTVRPSTQPSGSMNK